MIEADRQRAMLSAPQEEFDAQRAAAEAETRRRKKELRELLEFPPPYLYQCEIDAEKQQELRHIAACEKRDDEFFLADLMRGRTPGK